MKDKTAVTLKSKSRTHFVSALVLIILSLLCLVNHIKIAQTYFFIYEDVYVINHGRMALENPAILFQPDIAGRIHPVKYIFQGLLWHLFKWNPKGYYVTAFFFHLLLVTVVYVALRNAVGRRACLWGLILFLTGATHFQVLGHIGALGYVLEPILLLLMIIFFNRYYDNRSRLLFFGMPLLWVIAVWTREPAILTPVFLIVYCWLVKQTPLRHWREWVWIVPFVPVGIALIIINYLCVSLPKVSFYMIVDMHIAQNLVGFARAFLQMLLVPRRESVNWIPLPTIVSRIIPALMVASVVAWLAKSALPLIRARWRECVFLGLFFLTGITPYMLRPMGWYPQARYLYLASLGGFLLFGWILDACWQVHTGMLRRTLIVMVICYVFTVNYITLDLTIEKMQRWAPWSEPSGVGTKN